jgi:hypothetical protein
MANNVAHHFGKGTGSLDPEGTIRRFNRMARLRAAPKAGNLFRQLAAALVVLSIVPNVSIAQSPTAQKATAQKPTTPSPTESWPDTNDPAGDMKKVLERMHNASSDLSKAANECHKERPFKSGPGTRHPECDDIMDECINHPATCNPTPCPTCPHHH